MKTRRTRRVLVIKPRSPAVCVPRVRVPRPWNTFTGFTASRHAYTMLIIHWPRYHLLRVPVDELLRGSPAIFPRCLPSSWRRSPRPTVDELRGLGLGRRAPKSGGWKQVVVRRRPGECSPGCFVICAIFGGADDCKNRRMLVTFVRYDVETAEPVLQQPLANSALLVVRK